MPMIPPRAVERERGTTVIELTVASALLVVVLSIVFGTLVSLQNTDRRVQSLVTNEQAARFVLGEVVADIRSSNPLLGYSPAPEQYKTRIDLRLGPRGGPQSGVRWVYDTNPASPDYRTLTRKTFDPGTGAVTASTVKLRNIRNVDQGIDLFRFFNHSGVDLSAVTAVGNGADVGNCAIRVEVVLTADPEPGPRPIVIRSDAEVRNRLPGGVEGC